jgi:hypothetical protein
MCCSETECQREPGRYSGDGCEPVTSQHQSNRCHLYDQADVAGRVQDVADAALTASQVIDQMNRASDSKCQPRHDQPSFSG